MTRGCHDVPDQPCPMNEEQLRARCYGLVDELGILPPLDPVSLCRRLSSARGRRIRLVPADLGSTASVGHLVVTPRADRILYQRGAPQPQQTQVIYHEVMHLVLGHLDDDAVLNCGSFLSADDGPDRADRGHYADTREWEAEFGATILSEMSRVCRRPDRLNGVTGAAERGIAAAFCLAPGSWR